MNDETVDVGPDVTPGSDVEMDLLRGELEAERAARLVAEEAAEAAEAEAIEQRARAEKLDPVADVTNRIFENADDVIAFFPEQNLRDSAAAELKAMNKGRIKAGLLPIDWSPDEWDQHVVEEANKIVAGRHGLVPTSGPLTRVLKFLNPGTGNLVQIPIEDQVNNHKGSLADSIERYRRKGFKLTRPMFCGTRDCWELAIVDAAGNMGLDGYCSEDHRRRTEVGKESRDGDNVTSRRMLSV